MTLNISAAYRMMVWFAGSLLMFAIVVLAVSLIRQSNELEVSEVQYVNVVNIYARSNASIRDLIDWMYFDQRITESEYILIMKKSNIIYQGYDERA